MIELLDYEAPIQGSSFDRTLLSRVASDFLLNLILYFVIS